MKKRYKIIAAVLLAVVGLAGVFFGQQAQQQAAAARSRQLAQVEIMGKPQVTQKQAVAYIKRRNPSPELNCSVDELVGYYYQEAGSEGIRPDLALSQAIKETGCFAYGGDVSPQQNNYCGLGTTGAGVKGCTFSRPQQGVRAHIQHLLAYATKRPPQQELIDPRYQLLREKHPEIFGKVTTWVGLNGKWAVPGEHYGQDILHIGEEMKRENNQPEE